MSYTEYIAYCESIIETPIRFAAEHTLPLLLQRTVSSNRELESRMSMTSLYSLFAFSSSIYNIRYNIMALKRRCIVLVL